MKSFLTECFRRGRRPQLVQTVMDATGARANVQYQEDIAFMASVADESMVPLYRLFIFVDYLFSYCGAKEDWEREEGYPRRHDQREGP
jgi:hypothetical protein